MRNILFRGKRMDNREWVEGGSIIRFDPENDQELVFMPHMHEGCTSTHDNDDNITAFESGMFYKVDPATVGQYTGLTDKNGKKILEGDIIRYKDGGFVANGVVNFGSYAGAGRSNKGHMGFYLDWGENDLLRNDIVFWASERLIEIIGNIHDNPELMGGTENVSHP